MKRETKKRPLKTLERVLSKAGLGSRVEARSWVHAGRVTVNGKLTRNPDLWVDMKRDRELKVIETQLQQMRGAVKNAEARLADAKARKSDADAARASTDIANQQKAIAAKEKEREGLREAYTAQKKRYQELRGTAPAAPAAAAAPAPAPTAAAPAKK